MTENIQWDTLGCFKEDKLFFKGLQQTMAEKKGVPLAQVKIAHIIHEWVEQYKSMGSLAVELIPPVPPDPVIIEKEKELEPNQIIYTLKDSQLEKVRAKIENKNHPIITEPPKKWSETWGSLLDLSIDRFTTSIKSFKMKEL